MLKLNSDLVITFFMIIIIKLLLEFGYVNFVIYYFEYDGFTYNFDLFSYIISWIVYIFIYILLIIKKDLFIYDFYLFVYVLYVLPNIVFYTFTNHNIYYLVILLIPFTLITLFTFENNSVFIEKFMFGKFLSLFLSLTIILIVLVNFLITSGGKMVWNFSEVYELRGELEESISQNIFGYMNSWAFKLFSILFFSWAIYKKNIIMILISIFFITFLYTLSGHKSALVGLIIVPFFYYLYSYKSTTNLILGFFIFILLFSTFIGWVFDSIFPESLVVRRMFMVPAFLNFTYLDFFSDHDNIYWSNSILKYFLEYPYDKALPYVIGEYLGDDNLGANTGFIASGFAQANILGIFIYTFIVIILMNLLNFLAKDNSKYFVMSIIIMPLSSLFMSSDLPTTFLTHGLLIAIFILWLFTDKEYEINILNIRVKI